MLNLHPDTIAAILEHLNRPENVRGWRELLSGSDYEYHRSIERTAYDTDCSRLRQRLVDWVDERLREVARANWSKEDVSSAPFEILGTWLSCADAFVLSKAKKRGRAPWDRGDHEWLIEQSGRRPLSGFRVGGTAFWMPGAGPARFHARKWLGADDPFMHLPYQRKYDTERHGRADLQLRSYQEKLQIANDIVGVLSERLEDHEVSGKGVWPELTDIQAELEQLDLGFGVDDLGAMAGAVCVEIVELRTPLPGDEKRRIKHRVVGGYYRGVLGGYHRRRDGRLRPAPSPASLKWMLTCALSDLMERLTFLIGPPPAVDIED